jgi:hypothetical protein
VSGVLAAFANGLREAAGGDQITDDVVERTVIPQFRDLDRPQAPQVRGLRFWRENTVDILRRRRQIYDNLTKEQLRDAAKVLVDREPVIGVYSNEALAPAPDGFTVMQLAQLLNLEDTPKDVEWRISFSIQSLIVNFDFLRFWQPSRMENLDG